MAFEKQNSAQWAAVAGLFLLLGGLFVVWRPQPIPQRAAPEREVARRDLVQAQGRWCLRGQTNPFSGCMVDYYPTGDKLSRSEISNGLPNGLSLTWHTNGQMQVRECFKNGISDGVREKWYESGAKFSQATIVGGKIIGIFESWHENGQLNEQIEMKSGQPDGIARAYYPDGYLKSETTVSLGKIVNQRVWKDGEKTNTSR